MYTSSVCFYKFRMACRHHVCTSTFIPANKQHRSCVAVCSLETKAVLKCWKAAWDGTYRPPWLPAKKKMPAGFYVLASECTAEEVGYKALDPEAFESVRCSTHTRNMFLLCPDASSALCSVLRSDSHLYGSHSHHAAAGVAATVWSCWRGHVDAVYSCAFRTPSPPGGRYPAANVQCFNLIPDLEVCVAEVGHCRAAINS